MLVSIGLGLVPERKGIGTDHPHGLIWIIDEDHLAGASIFVPEDQDPVAVRGSAYAVDGIWKAVNALILRHIASPT